MKEFHDELRAVARDALSKGVGWSSFAEMGWLGLEVPETLDGSGATFEEVAIVLHELGRAAASSAYLGTAVLAVGALQLAGTEQLLRELANGATAAVVLPTGDDTDVQFRLQGGRLSGSAPFVPDAPGADHLLVVAVEGKTPVLVHAGGLAVTEQPVVDATRRLGSVEADGAVVTDVWSLGEDALEQLLDRGALAIACDSLGLAAAMVETTAAYAAARQQFGRPIGSFQAVKHACADMLVAVTVGTELIASAVRTLDTRAVSMAKATVTASAVAVTGKAMQLHGGVGYTWESGIHVYLKRAALNRSLFGSPAVHRRRIGRAYAAPFRS